MNSFTTLLAIIAAIAFIVIVAHLLQRILVDRRWSKNPAPIHETPPYPKLNDELLHQLERIEPSHDFNIHYRPCSVTLLDGSEINCVLMMPAETFFKHWGLPSEKVSGKNFVQIQDVARIEESPSRLPPDIADKIYRAGESRMGSHHFTLIFNDRSEQEYMTGGAVDFVPFPAGKSRSDVMDVVPGFGSGKDVWQSLRSYKCLYS